MPSSPAFASARPSRTCGNPGYFLIKIALWVMALAIIGQALVDIFRPLKADER